MSKLNKDVISLILKELYDRGNTLYSCLLVDRTWNTKFYFLCNYSRYNFTSGTELCFSELGYLRCTSTQNSSILAGRLAILNTSIKKLNFDILYFSTHNCGITKLIEGQKNLNEVIFNNQYLVTLKEYIVRPLEEALIKCADTIQYLKIDWKPVTNLFSHLVNLISLEIHAFRQKNWNHLNHLEKISLPHLKYLKAHYVPSKILAKFENLLINCQILNGLEIFCVHDYQINWKILFEILTRSTPISLFKFKFIYSIFNSYLNINLESLKLFLDNWKDRSSMLLQIFSSGVMLNVEQKQHQLKLEDLLQKYKTKGVIKNYNTNNLGTEDFEWIQCKLHTLYD
ncbi:hypothetical protein RhiirA5_506695 [Rhizophagus irregularis]|uniref:F-box domain-containing protein n=1 Tax=Rhizophagus irregularis TaxID=588596 RepID=A0A2N0NRL6_9GLOM|nr:hypothetical protein RhiirA5_506695 [Rhizophagus irregularis]